MILTNLNTEHYKWGKDCDGWKFVDNEFLSVIFEKMPSETNEKLHYHKYAFQFFYILKGEAIFEIENDKFIIKDNQGIKIEPLMKHRILNKSGSDLEFIVISQPTTKKGDRFEVE